MKTIERFQQILVEASRQQRERSGSFTPSRALRFLDKFGNMDSNKILRENESLEIAMIKIGAGVIFRMTGFLATSALDCGVYAASYSASLVRVIKDRKMQRVPS